MGKKRKYQGEPANMFEEKKKGQPNRKRRKLTHSQGEASKSSGGRKKVVAPAKQTPVPDQPAYRPSNEEIDVPAKAFSFLEQLDPAEFAIIPTRSVRNAKKTSQETIPDFEKGSRRFPTATDSTKMPTKAQGSGKVEQSAGSGTLTSSELLKQAQEKVKDRVKLHEQHKKLERDGDKKVSAAKAKRKEVARQSNQLKEISSSSIDISRVPDLLRIGWKDMQRTSAGLQHYLQMVKEYIASLASTIIEDPQSNCKILLDLEIICKYYPKLRTKNQKEETDEIRPTAALSHLFTQIRQLAILSLVAVLNDITPGYRVRADNDDIKSQPLKKSVRDVRIFEFGVLSSYNRFLDFIAEQLKHKRLVEICVKACCSLLNANSTFNCRERIIQLIIPFMNSEEKELYVPSCQCINTLFQNDELGQASQEAVRFIMQYTKSNSYNVRPDMVDTFLELKFTQDLSGSLRGGLSGNSTLSKKAYHGLSGNKKKLHRHEKELAKDLQESTALQNKKLMTHYQAEILKSIFSLYFRVLKMEARTPLLDAVLRGLAKYAHLINLEFQTDLFHALRQLMSHDDCSVETILQCAITAFENMQMHGNTIDIDLKDFYERVYEVLLDVPKELTCLPNLLHCIKLMISNNRQLDITRVAAYSKRLLTITLALPTNAALSIIITIQRLMQTFPAIRPMIEAAEDRSAARYNPYIHQPDHCHASTATMWELSLLEAHYHPTVSERSMQTADAEGTQLIPLDVLRQFDTSNGGFNPAIRKPRPHPFDNVVKNAPNSKCYINPPKNIPTREEIMGEDEEEDDSIFVDYFRQQKKFSIKLEKEKLRQQLSHYQALLAKYLEFNE